MIHISGLSGSGKTTIGKKLAEHYDNKVIVKDLDDLRDEFLENNKFNERKYQKYINDFILYNTSVVTNTSVVKKPLIFVGLNDNILGKNKSLYYDLQTTHNFFIDADDTEILQNKCKRLFADIPNNKLAMKHLVENNELFIKRVKHAIDTECNLKKTIQLNKRHRKEYKAQNYIFINKKDVYKTVVKLIGI
jgi:predicted PilT family ATPase